MNRKNPFTTLLTLIVLLSVPRLLDAQSTGILKGSVTDMTTGETLIGANVVLAGTSIGTIADLEGNYTLRNLPSGTNRIIISYIGYQSDTLTVQIAGNRSSELNISLSPGSVAMEEVVITMQAKGQYAAINQQISSSKIKNVVASDKIKEVPDVNAAEAIGRLPGVSIQRSNGEGDRVVIRGLSPKYNVITVDGVRLPPDGSWDRSTGLSFLSADMLDGIEVSKSLTADMDADALGGTVNLKLREAAEGFHFNLKALGAYSDMANSFSDYNLTGSVSNRFLNNRLGILLLANTENRARNSDNMSAGYSIPEPSTTDSGAYNIYTDNAYLTEHIGMVRRTGGTLMLDYKTENWTIKFKNILNLQNSDNLDRSNKYDFVWEDELTQTVSESFWKKTVRSHTLSNSFTFWNTDLDIDATYVSVKSQGTMFGSLYADKDAAQSDTAFSFHNRLYRNPADLISQVLVDSMHQASLVILGAGDQGVTDENIILKGDWKIPVRLGDWGAGHVKVGGKYHQTRRKSDRDWSAVDFRHGLGGNPRDAVYREFPEMITAGELPGYRDVDGIPAINFIDEDYDWGEFMDGQYTSAMGWTIDHQKAKEVHKKLYTDYNLYYFRNTTAFDQDYEVTETLAAWYIMAELNFLNNRLMLLPGVRFEQKRSDFTSNKIVLALTPMGYSQIEPVQSERLNSHLFPSINAKFKLNESSQLQGAVYKSATRPSFMDITPMAIIPEQTGWFTKQNPQMEPAVAWNFDLGYAYYTNKIGLLTINGFYKQIDGLTSYLGYEPFKLENIIGLPEDISQHLIGPEYFEGIFTGDPTIYSSMPFNSGFSATVKGIEFSLQTNFRYLPGPLSGIVLDVNATLLTSNRKHDYLKIEGVATDTIFGVPVYENFYLYDNREAKFVDQPNFLFNVRVGYEYKGFSSHLSFRYQKNTLSWVDTRWSLRDSYIDDIFQVDFAVRQKITKHISFTANLQNINKFMDERFMDAGGAYILPTSRQYYGRSIQAGVSYTF
ncbi:MAG: TonB-dependent receptor [Bacteroidota bacterium]